MAASTLRIRPFEPGDLAALQRVREAAFRPVFRSFRELVGGEIAGLALADADGEQARTLDGICRAESGHSVLVALSADEIVGFVSFTVDAERRTGEIGLNAVHPEHAGRGIGTAMYRHVLDLMRERGAAVASVGTGGDPSHAPARRAYAKAGFGPAIPSLWLYRRL